LLSPSSRFARALYNVARANQATVRLPQLPDHDVDRVMQPIREIAVEVTGWAEQRLVPIRFAAIGVRPRITFARVRLDLGDTDGNRRFGIGALEHTAKQGRGHLQHVASEETTVRETHTVKVNH
jgi:hypothetical protein